jgi:uncharacterized protein YjbI with pentapeptide repeats
MSADERKPMQGRIKLDGKTFKDVSFQQAQLIYEGGLPPNFVNCTFEAASFVFEGAAGNTTNFMRAMLQRQSNMRGVVLGLMPEIENR